MVISFRKFMWRRRAASATRNSYWRLQRMPAKDPKNVENLELKFTSIFSLTFLYNLYIKMMKHIHTLHLTILLVT